MKAEYETFWDWTSKKKIAHLIKKKYHYIAYIINEGSEDEAEEGCDRYRAYCGEEENAHSVTSFSHPVGNLVGGTLEQALEDGAEICGKCLERLR